MKKRLVIAGGVTVMLLVVGGVLLRHRIARARMVASLFSGAEQYENFCRVHELFPAASMPAAPMPHEFGSGTTITLPDTYTYAGEERNVQQLLRETDTSALLVLQNGDVVFEQYWLTGGRNVTWLSMSVAKSFVSALVGIAVEEGAIGSIEDPITGYVPELTESAYDGVRIKDILQMSSGARWNEDYSDPDSDINRFGRIFALGGSLDELAASLTRENEPGTVCHYNSMDTQALGMLLVRATGRPLAEFMTEKLWHPIGAESQAWWIVDGNQMEMAFGGLNATARDYAKIGELYRLNGEWNGQQIVPRDWVQQSVTPDGSHVQPKAATEEDGAQLGYGFQWWIPYGEEGEFTAIGVYNQFVYVNPTRGMVIAKLSANSDYGTSTDESSYRESETVELFRSIVTQVTGKPDIDESQDGTAGDDSVPQATADDPPTVDATP